METLISKVEAAGGSVWAEGNTLKYRLPEGQDALVGELREHKAEVISILKDRTKPECPAVWLPAFEKWTRAECTFRDRCYGGISVLHKHFCRWCNSHQSVPCAPQSFESLLRDQFRFLLDQGFWTEADIKRGVIYGVILREDWESRLKGEIGEPITQPTPEPKAPWSPSAKSYRILKRENVLGPIEESERGTMFDPAVFIPFTLDQLQAALDGDSGSSGGWTVTTLVERLHAFGVTVGLT